MLEKILTRHPEMEYVQLQLNYLDSEDEHIQSRLCYETAARYGKPVIVMEPVKGRMSGHSFLQKQKSFFMTFIRISPMLPGQSVFAASPENVMVVLSGMKQLGSDGR